jgi:hypothetical protein
LEHRQPDNKLLDQARICKMYIKHNAVISSV